MRPLCNAVQISRKSFTSPWRCCSTQWSSALIGTKSAAAGVTNPITVHRGATWQESYVARLLILESLRRNIAASHFTPRHHTMTIRVARSIRWLWNASYFSANFHFSDHLGSMIIFGICELQRSRYCTIDSFAVTSLNHTIWSSTLLKCECYWKLNMTVPIIFFFFIFWKSYFCILLYHSKNYSKTSFLIIFKIKFWILYSLSAVWNWQNN